MKLLLPALAAFLACIARPGAAQQGLEIIPLRHATVEQVLPVLRPLVEPGGALSGHRGQLIVRASPANLAEIRRALDAIDRPRRQLVILVRYEDWDDAARETIEGAAVLGHRGARVDVRAEAQQSSGEGRIDQRVRVLEGGRALIAMGQGRPLRQRQVIQTPAGVVAQDSLVVHEASTGFEVLPRLAGERVVLDIAPQRQAFAGSLGATPGAIDAQQVASSVSAWLGEWVEIGSVVANARRRENGLLSAGGTQASETRRIWVRVEEAGN